jgi:hypothetical protein
MKKNKLFLDTMHVLQLRQYLISVFVMTAMYCFTIGSSIAQAAEIIWNCKDGSVTTYTKLEFVTPMYTGDKDLDKEVVWVDYRSFVLLSNRILADWGIVGEFELRSNENKVDITIYPFKIEDSQKVLDVANKIFVASIYEHSDGTVCQLYPDAFNNIRMFPINDCPERCKRFEITAQQKVLTERTIQGERRASCSYYYPTRQPVFIKMETGYAPVKIESLGIPGLGHVSAVDLFLPKERKNEHSIALEDVDIRIEKSNEKGQLHLSMTLRGRSNSVHSVSDMTLSLYLRANGNDTEILKKPLIPGQTIPLSSEQTFSLSDAPSFELSDLRTGSYYATMDYTVENADEGQIIHFKQKIYIGSYRYNPDGIRDLQVYEINKESYQGIPVFKLRGGMSAEYVVQKALTALKRGVSHTWHVHSLSGEPDMKGGGPVPVWGQAEFLQMSIDSTIAAYDTNLGATTPFENVIIGTGIANVPYLAAYMNAPFLPLQFLTAAIDLDQVKKIVDAANRRGPTYSCYATAGYDPSMPNIGVAWIKLLDLPEEYLQFLERHKVKNVIFIGAGEEVSPGEGERLARKIKYPDMPQGKYGKGSIYVMQLGEAEGQKILKSSFLDYQQKKSCGLLDKFDIIADWEGGIADIQISSFAKGIEDITENIYAIRTTKSLDFYQWASFLALKLLNKNNMTPSKIYLNEYVIGYPLFEIQDQSVPYLYWQGLLGKNIREELTTYYLYPRVVDEYTEYLLEEFLDWEVHLNAKADRSGIKTELQTAGPTIDGRKDPAFTNVTMNNWQKADVWDTSDGMNAPCEKVAERIIEFFGSYEDYKNEFNDFQWITMEDLRELAKNSLKDPPKKSFAEKGAHPESVITRLAEFGNTEINKYEFPPSKYWQTIRSANKIRLDSLTPLNYHTTDKLQDSLLGHIEAYRQVGKKRRQTVHIAEIDLTDTSDEYELVFDYVFNLNEEEDDYPGYKADLGNKQEMVCYEYVNVPHNSWMDIPSRVMARNGALWVVNGSVYDFDYNGIPGVVSMIKHKGKVYALPNILSFKGEGVFAWDWSDPKNKRVVIGHRDTMNVPAEELLAKIKNEFYNDQIMSYPNILGGMTYMTKAKDYNIEDLQPEWMKSWPDFPSEWLGPRGNSIRAELTQNLSSLDAGYNDCGSLKDEKKVQEFSALCYRQYSKMFDRTQNARTFVALKENKLHVGVVSGDMGRFPNYEVTKYWGLHNFELSYLVRYMGYDHAVNLDGGSSSMFWVNGKGPLHKTDGYILYDDNQGPYNSRLTATFLMLKPKLHIEQIPESYENNLQYLLLDNSAIPVPFDDAAYIQKKKAFVDLSPCMEQIKQNPTNPNECKGVIAMNFKVSNPDAKGAVLFSMGEDMYYEDTGGKRYVYPVYRNMVIMGLGEIPQPLLDTLRTKKKFGHSTSNNQGINDKHPLNIKTEGMLNLNSQSFYYIRIIDGAIATLLLTRDEDSDKYLDGNWHTITLNKQIKRSYPIDPVTLNQKSIGYTFHIWIDEKELSFTYSPDYFPYNFVSVKGVRYGFLSFDIPTTHAMIGAVNLDGRFLTSNAKLSVDNFILINGKYEIETISTIGSLSGVDRIHYELKKYKAIPLVLRNYYNNPTCKVFALTFEETEGMHSFSYPFGNEESPADRPAFYGLNLNAERASWEGAKALSFEPNALLLDGASQTEQSSQSQSIEISSLVLQADANELNVMIRSDQDQRAQVSVIDIVGRVALQESHNLRQGYNTVKFTEVNQLIPGPYFLMVHTITDKISSKFIIH